MQTGKIITDLRDLEDGKKFDSLVKYIGTRTREELKIICGLKKKAHAFLVEKCGRDPKDNETELEALLAAAANYRTHRPHSAKTLLRIDAERKEREQRHANPNAGKGLRGKLENDLADIETYRENGYSWTEIAKELRTRDSRYKGLPLKPNTLRKTYSRILADNGKTAEPEIDTSCIRAEPPTEPAPELEIELPDPPTSDEPQSADVDFL